MARKPDPTQDLTACLELIAKQNGTEWTFRVLGLVRDQTASSGAEAAAFRDELARKLVAAELARYGDTEHDEVAYRAARRTVALRLGYNDDTGTSFYKLLRGEDRHGRKRAVTVAAE